MPSCFPQEQRPVLGGAESAESPVAGRLAARPDTAFPTSSMRPLEVTDTDDRTLDLPACFAKSYSSKHISKPITYSKSCSSLPAAGSSKTAMTACSPSTDATGERWEDSLHYLCLRSGSAVKIAD